MAISVTSSPVSVPSGIRITAGIIDFNSTSYSAGGLAVTAAQFGGGSNGIPNRLPDFVILGGGSAADDNDADGVIVGRYFKATGKVAIYGSEPLVDEVGLGEDDGSPQTRFDYLAVWVTPDPAGITTA